MNILILGSGGREHAFALKIADSKLTDKLYVAPGNSGTQEIATNIPININDFEQVKKKSLELGISMIIVMFYRCQVFHCFFVDFERGFVSTSKENMYVL